MEHEGINGVPAVARWTASPGLDEVVCVASLRRFLDAGST